MARIRTIKPEFWEDEKIAKLPIPCRLFFIGCWNYADDFGCIKGSPSLLKAQIFPYDENLKASEVKKWIETLVDARMLIPISHVEESYYFIRTFRRHQILDSRYSKSYIGKEKAKELICKSLEEYNVITSSSPGENDTTTTQEKEKEKEVEVEKKESANADKKETPVSSLSPEYKKFLIWMKKYAPYCSNEKNFSKQITENEFLKLKSFYSGKQISTIIEQIENRKDLRKRYTNLYRTVLNWAKKEYGNE